MHTYKFNTYKKFVICIDSISESLNIVDFYILFLNSSFQSCMSAVNDPGQPAVIK